MPLDTGECPYPDCGKVFEVGPNQYGKGFECPYCGGRVNIFRDESSPQPENGNGNGNGHGEVIQLQMMILERDIHELRQFSKEKKRIPGARRMLRKLEAKLADLQKELQ